MQTDFMIQPREMGTYQGNIFVNTNIEWMMVALPRFSSQPCSPNSFIILEKAHSHKFIDNYTKSIHMYPMLKPHKTYLYSGHIMSEKVDVPN